MSNDDQARRVQEVIERERPGFDVRGVTYLDSGIDTDVYGAEIWGTSVVLKVTEDPNTIVVAERAMQEGPRGVAPILDVIDDENSVIIVQDRAHRHKDLDKSRYPKISGYAAPVVASALEDAVWYLEGRQAQDFPEMADDRTLARMPEWDDMEEIAHQFVVDLESGAAFIATAGEWNPDEVLYDWALKNVGVLEGKDEPRAVVIDLGLVL